MTDFPYSIHTIIILQLLKAMVPWLGLLTPEGAVQVRALTALAGDIVLCSLGKTLCSHGASLHPGV